MGVCGSNGPDSRKCGRIPRSDGAEGQGPSSRIEVHGLGFPRSWTAPLTVRGTRDTAKSAVRGTPDTAKGAVRGTRDNAMSAVRDLRPKYGGYMPQNGEYTRKKSRYMQDFGGMAFF